jgi:hypothetical protein
MRALEKQYRDDPVSGPKYRAQRAKYRRDNKIKLNAKAKLYNSANQETIKTRRRISRVRDREKRAAYMKRYRLANKERLHAYHTAYNTTHRTEQKEFQRAYRIANPEAIRRSNERQVRVGGVYMGLFGLTKREMKKWQDDLERDFNSATEDLNGKSIGS